ncbi:response regulator [Oceanidesulfovibrio indonesiensis]|uniref:Response regulator n=1 Tax=Oceanidesulfovibrio indonesiensis TaxID=54767 RepID=A0A7M3MGB2_9BACT|nr:response regulator [Oceanidesulfovibrio indonesiensis]TVM17897.1 response regulator [Oceanidesulfovibrio indonesiensis]
MSAPETPERPIRLLLVDDEESFVSVLTKRLRRRGVDVTPVLSGAEALRLIRKQEFDVMLLDLKMEEMSGLEVLKTVRIVAPETPVIMLTGHGSEQAAREGVTLGASDYLLKPCDLDVLFRKITKAAHKARAQQ